MAKGVSSRPAPAAAPFELEELRSFLAENARKVGERTEFRLGEELGKLVGWLAPRRWAPVQARDVARALVEAGGARAWSRRLEKSCLHAAAEGVTFGAALLSASVGAVAAKSKAIQIETIG